MSNPPRFFTPGGTSSSSQSSTNAWGLVEQKYWEFAAMFCWSKGMAVAFNIENAFREIEKMIYGWTTYRHRWPVSHRHRYQKHLKGSLLISSQIEAQPVLRIPTLFLHLIMIDILSVWFREYNSLTKFQNSTMLIREQNRAKLHQPLMLWAQRRVLSEFT